jgi:hypothetical protein
MNTLEYVAAIAVLGLPNPSFSEESKKGKNKENTYENY